MDVTEWTALLLILGGATAAFRWPTRAPRPRRHLRCVESRLSCPKTGADVDCELMRDGCTGVYARVESCTGSDAKGKPACEQDCVWSLNLGIPLPPSDAVRKDGAPEEIARSIER